LIESIRVAEQGWDVLRLRQLRQHPGSRQTDGCADPHEQEHFLYQQPDHVAAEGAQRHANADFARAAFHGIGLMTYKRQADAARRAALTELAAYDQALGI